MTDTLDHIRETALPLPEVTERIAGDATVFAVEGNDFVRIAEDTVMIRTDDGWATFDADADPATIEDAVVHAWELAAPRALLEAGGR